MEVENMSRDFASNKHYIIEGSDQDDHVPLPGFRFHPTDEELVEFYLRRKVEKKPISIELIKEAYIYKYDPWDLPKSTNVGEKDKEWYFFCKRGRKYKNSVRPNRVTGSGFWKATGIDRPIYSGRDCIGLKKTLVYYRGSAGKGSKTEWMMHEFRLPAKHMDAIYTINAPQEAEVWTLCRILRRSAPYKKCVHDWRLIGVNKKSKSNVVLIDPSSSETTCSVESSDRNGPSSYISFSNQNTNTDHEKSLCFSSQNGFSCQQYARLAPSPAVALSSYPNYDNDDNNICGDIDELIRHADWEDLRSVVSCAAATTSFSSSMYL